MVILSPHFFEKNWTRKELDGLFARETASGDKVILPVWHRVTKDDVTRFSPMLADKVALSTGVSTVAEIALRLAAEVEAG